MFSVHIPLYSLSSNLFLGYDLFDILPFEFWVLNWGISWDNQLSRPFVSVVIWASVKLLYAAVSD